MTKTIKYILIVILAIVAVVGFYLLAKTSSHTAKSSQGTTQTQISNKGLGSSQSPSQSLSNQPAQSSTSTGQSSNTNSNLVLVSPTGQFVSNHNPSLSSTVTSSESSSCNTTPGASCTITFTNNNVVKSLPTQVVDQYGGTTWSWTVEGVGLTQGSWLIEANATLSGQTKSATDAQMLNVGP